MEPEETDLKAAFRETEEEAGFGKEDLRVIEGFQKILNVCLFLHNLNFLE